MVYKVIICILILPNKMNFSKQILGSSLSLPAYGREGQGQHLFSWRRISQSEIRNSQCLTWSQLLNEARTFFERISD